MKIAIGTTFWNYASGAALALTLGLFLVPQPAPDENLKRVTRTSLPIPLPQYGDRADWEKEARSAEMARSTRDHEWHVEKAAAASAKLATNTRLLFHDANGSAIAATLMDGTVVNRTEYDAWGNVRSQQGESLSHGYAGLRVDRHLERATGEQIYYAQQRYYLADQGRFNRTDPIAAVVDDNPLQWNSYLYGYANPLKYHDPNGRRSLLIDLGLCAGNDCQTYSLAAESLPLVPLEYAQTADEASAIRETQLREQFFGGIDAFTFAPLQASGAGRFSEGILPDAGSQFLAQRQRTRDRNAELGVPNTYPPIGQGLEAAGSTAFYSIPGVAVIDGGRQMATAETRTEFAMGFATAVLGAAEVGAFLPRNRGGLDE